MRPTARRRATGVTGSYRLASDTVIAIGASTGGTEALKEILRAMPHDAPGIVIVQHMPAGFTAAFAEHLADICKMEVGRPSDGDRVVRGRALLARGDRHLRGPPPRLRPGGRGGRRPPVCRHRPSVDVLFRSVAEAVGRQRRRRHPDRHGRRRRRRPARDEARRREPRSPRTRAPRVVFGMPKEAIDRGAVDVVLPLPRIAAGILQRVPAVSGPGAAVGGR